MLGKILRFFRSSPLPTRRERPLGDAPLPKLGLALSSGGARGLAHVGVLQVLEENGIEIHAIAGSSMGAYIGALWAVGFSGKALEDLAAEMQDRRQLWKLADPMFPPMRLQVDVTFVPEPGAVGVIGGCGAVGLARRRRRGRG